MYLLKVPDGSSIGAITLLNGAVSPRLDRLLVAPDGTIAGAFDDDEAGALRAAGYSPTVICNDPDVVRLTLDGFVPVGQAAGWTFVSS